MTAHDKALVFRRGHLDLLLGVLQRQLNAFEREKTPDMLLMRDIIEYLCSYAAAAETVLIDETAPQDDHFTSVRVVLAAERRILRGPCERCLAVLDIIIDGHTVPRSMLAHSMQRLIRLFWAHLDRERCDVFRHQPASSVTCREGPRETPPRQQRSMQMLADLYHRIQQAAAKTHRVPSGAFECPACSVEPESRVRTVPPTQ